MHTYKKYLFLWIASALIVVLAACSDSATPSNKEDTVQADETEVAETIEVTDITGQTLTFEEAPSTVAALSSGDLDILLALGADVVGRPTVQGPIDQELETIQEIGNPHQPNFEKIAEVHPEVIVASPSFQQYASNMEAQGTKVVYTAANSVDDILGTIDTFGEMLGKSDEAKALRDTLVKQLEEAAPEQTNVKTLLVYGAPGSYLVALPTSLSGDLLERAGGENIAADFPKEENYPQYASLSTEKIIERNPEAIMLITHGDPEAVQSAFEGEMQKNPAWKNLDAVKNGNVTVLPSDLFGTNPGTRVAEALNVMSESLKEAQTK